MATGLEDIIAEVDSNPQLARALSERLVTPDLIIRMLDEDPELLETLRARLLTRELLELPRPSRSSWKRPTGGSTK